MTALHKHLRQNKLIVLVTIFIFVYASCSHPRNSEQTSSKSQSLSIEQNIVSSSSDGEPRQAMPKSTIKDTNSCFENLEAALADIPKDTFDPQAVIDMCGAEPAALFKWVRDNTYLVPYRGILRGPAGVLMDRVGNSVDRALLLCELMRSAGHRVRLAYGVLSEDQALEIWNEVRPFPADKIQNIAELSSKDIDDLVATCSLKYQMDKEETRSVIERLMEGQRRLEKSIEDSITLQTSSIQKSIEKYLDKYQKDIEPKWKAIKEHWWVQWAKDESWLDLDPTCPDTQLGQASIDPQDTYQLNEIDEDLFHHLIIRVIVERWEGGSLEENIVLEHKIIPYEIIGKRVTVLNYPVNWPPENQNLSEEKDSPDAQKAALLSMSEWLPVLTIGSEQIKNLSFTTHGEIKESPEKKRKTKSSSGLLGAFGRIRENRESSEGKKRDALLTAEWIEYELSSPGQPPRKIRRPVFDELGPAARSDENVPRPELSIDQQAQRNLTLSLSSTGILIQACQLSPDFFAHELATNLIHNRSFFSDLILQKEPPNMDEDLADEMEKLSPLPSPLSLFAMSRLEFSRLNHFYLEKPNLFNFTLEPSMDSQGNVSFRFVLDILANEWAVFPYSGSTAFLARLEQGVLETNLEALFWGTIGNVEPNTAKLFEQSLREGKGWLLIRDDRDPNWKKVRLPADARALINESLKEGYWALVPQAPYSYDDKELAGWWRIHPVTGDTLGMMESGRGQALTNYAITVLKKGAPFWLMLGCKAIDLKRGICDPCAIFAFSLLWTAGKLLISLMNWVQGEIATIAIFKIFLVKGPAWLSLLINSLNLITVAVTVDPCLKRISS